MTIKHALPNAFPNFTKPFPIPPVKATPTISIPDFKAKKAGKKGFHFFLLLDESGSMGGLKNDTIGGVNSLIEKQREDDDDTKITIVKFEGGKIKVPVEGKSVASMEKFTDYQPAGGTNLLDAVGFTINKVNQLLGTNKKKRDRPSIFIQIITDGQENCSNEFTRDQIRNMVSKCEGSDWVITYVGANVDSFAEATSMGISSAATSNYSAAKTSDTYLSLASSMTRMKSMRSAGLAASEIYASGAVYTADEKKKMGE